MSKSRAFEAPRPKGNGDAATQASEWAAYLHSGGSTPAGRGAFEAWLAASADNRRAFERLEQTWRNLDHAIVWNKDLDASSGAIADTSRERNRRPRVPGVPSIAASIAAGVVAIGVAGYGVWRAATYDPITATQFSSGIGEIETVTLEDGTAITLGASSTLTTRFSKNARRAELTRGQAYFDVAAEAARVFSVRAAGTEVRVLGTEFDIAKRSSGVTVSVLAGLVDVVDLPDEDEPGNGRSVQLTGGEQVHAQLDGALSDKAAFAVDDAMGWREGRLDYKSTPLGLIIEDVNRYRTDKIVLEDEALAETVITITLPTDNTDLLLSGLAMSEDVEIERDYRGVVITPKPE